MFCSLHTHKLRNQVFLLEFWKPSLAHMNIMLLNHLMHSCFKIVLLSQVAFLLLFWSKYVLISYQTKFFIFCIVGHITFGCFRLVKVVFKAGRIRREILKSWIVLCVYVCLKFAFCHKVDVKQTIDPGLVQIYHYFSIRPWPCHITSHHMVRHGYPADFCSANNLGKNIYIDSKLE